jgi:hypothetical protein
MKIEYIHRALVEKFAAVFAGDKKGFSAREISEYFIGYSNLVKHIDFYGFTPTRPELFIESLYSLEPKLQYYALNDLTLSVYSSKYTYPDEKTRESLRVDLHNLISPSPIGLAFSKLRETAFRLDWVEANRRISADPAGATTAARTLLETTLKTIIEERGGKPDGSGDIGKLVKQAEKILGFDPKDHPGEHQVFSGIASVLNGLACLSNEAGDRHGTVGGVGIEDPSVAEVCVNACGTLALFFIERHLFSKK